MADPKPLSAEEERLAFDLAMTAFLRLAPDAPLTETHALAADFAGRILAARAALPASPEPKEPTNG